MATVASTVGWTEISPLALRRMRAELENHEQGVLDEMGVGALHAGYADAFFPGTSVLQTRARYLLFVPWTYLWLAQAGKRVSAANVQPRKEEVENWLVGRLRGEEVGHGIIGGDVYPEPPAQPPDVVYWTALRTFRLYDGTASRAQLLARWDHRRVVRREEVITGEEDVDEPPLACFAVPPPPPWWKVSDAEVNFALTEEEAIFLRDRLVTSLPDRLFGMAASMLGKRRRPTGRRLCDDAFFQEAAGELDARRGDGHGQRLASVTEALERTRAASAIACLVRAIYAALVETQREKDLEAVGKPLPDDITTYREKLRGFWESEVTVREARALDLPGIATDIPLAGDLRVLLEHVHARVKSVRAPGRVEARLLDEETRTLFQRIERKRKGMRARLPERDGLPRREGFTGTTINIAGLGFRYEVAQRLLLDLHGGLFP